MAAVRRRRRTRQNSSSDSTHDSSSSDDDDDNDIPLGKVLAPPVAQRKALSLEDDENTLVHSAAMLDDDGNPNTSVIERHTRSRSTDEPGESDAERTTSKRTTRSAVLKITDSLRKPPIAARKRKRCERDVR